MSFESAQRILLHAPNVHVGGGLVLLQTVLSAVDPRLRWAQLDVRATGTICQSSGMLLRYVRPSFISRLMAELQLWRTCRHGDVVLCFNSLPPLFPLRGRVVVFVQNRLLIESGSLAEYTPAVQARISVERLWSRLLQRRCSRYIVQTSSMAVSLKRWLHQEVPISVLPFAPTALPTPTCDPISAGLGFNFVYVASGEAHKNHRNLLEAWRLLAEAGVRPSLALTVDSDAYPSLCAHITQFSEAHGLSVTNLGVLSSETVGVLYRAAGAMIYPSKCESLGLPLIEAAQRGVPILAPELDYVRDVVEPAETFDSSSPVSIYRAVRRFLGVAEVPLKIGSTAAFLDEVLR